MSDNTHKQNFNAIIYIIIKKGLKNKKMERKPKVATPVYQQIATDVASKIVDKHYRVGDKIYARSSLSSQYGVSPETARRAICILSDLDIVDTSKGSGVIIKSYENAVKFIQHYHEIQTVTNLKQEITTIAERQVQEMVSLQEQIKKLLDKTERFRHINPFTPFDVEILDKTPYLGKTAAEINFWHNTSATIIAIKRGDSIFISPGPYAAFLEKDIIYFIGDENCLERVHKFMYPDK